MSIKNPAQLVVIETGQPVSTYDLEDYQTTIGRHGSDATVKLNSPTVSSNHGLIVYRNGRYFYHDLASTNGTYFKGKRVPVAPGQKMSAPVGLNDGDVFLLGQTGKIYLAFCATSHLQWKFLHLEKKSQITIGRGAESDIQVPTVAVSRNHAVINNRQGTVTITDLRSVNGTYLNGAPIKGTHEFKNNDVIRVGNTRIIRIGKAVIFGVPNRERQSYVTTLTLNAVTKDERGNPYSKPELKKQEMIVRRAEQQLKKKNYSGGGVEVVVNDISRIVPCKQGTGINGGNKKYILSHVSLAIRPGELVAILGGSGAGKTTFMNCINGFEPATEGTVYINGTELYKNYSTIKSTIGYVPQQDIVHDDLTLEAMLTYTGKLRLPKDITKQELAERVADVMDMVDLTAQKDTFIKKLSGGQRKRASIAVELISDPSLFFLDAPTSGLDPEAETNLMHQLRRLSDEKGKTVIVITHTLQNIQLFDKVIFLAPGGKLCFYGSPEQAKKFFNVTNLADAYEKISQDIDGYVNRYNALNNQANRRAVR